MMQRPGARPADLAIEALIPPAAAGDPAAWRALWTLLEPRLVGLARRDRAVGPLRGSDDDCRNIAVEVMARLDAGQRRRLKRYLEARSADRDLRFIPWLVVVAHRTAIDYLRGHDAFLDLRARPGADGATGAWVGFAGGGLVDERRAGASRDDDGLVDRGTADELVRYAGQALPPLQQRALDLWSQGASPVEIAAALDVPPRTASRLVRAAVERLRRHFRAPRQGRRDPRA
jgi:DNA-directed RNA polymerase specialized sigma24 family protein